MTRVRRAILGLVAALLVSAAATVLAINRALSHPLRGYPHRSSRSWCYVTTVRITTSSGHVLRTLDPSVLVSPRTHDVITAAPQGRRDCAIA